MGVTVSVRAQVDLRCLEGALGAEPGGGDLGALLGGGGESWLGLGLGDAAGGGGCPPGRAFQELFL